MIDPDQAVRPLGPPVPAGSVPDAPRLALASRGDALTGYLLEAMRRRFGVVERIDPELSTAQRYQVAALTFRASRARWVERFYKSGHAHRLRSANAARQLTDLSVRPDAVLQVHALFEPPSAPTALYIDCTHRQSAELWPAWNPLRGDELALWYRREHRTYAAAQHLFAFSRPTRDSLVHDYGIAPEKVTVTGAGANLARLPDLRADPSMREDRPPTILFVGNDFVRKGGAVLLDAFRAIRTAVPEARLQIAGTRPPVRSAQGVEVLGRIRDRAALADLYASASVFVLPSYFDPYPLVLLEAMAFGLPVVTTEQTGTPEMIDGGRTGVLVQPGRADELAEAVLGVLRDPDSAARLGAAARRAVEQRFTWDGVVDRMTPALKAMTSAWRR